MASPSRSVRSFAFIVPTMALGFVASLGAMQMMGRDNVAPLALANAAGGSRQPAPSGESVIARFALCSDGGGEPCVVDGDTLRYAGRRIRILGIDTPELHPARCATEERLGQAAKLRMQALVNLGPFQLVADGHSQDVYGRDLRKIMRGGTDLGLQLISEGLARPYGGGRQRWC